MEEKKQSPDEMERNPHRDGPPVGVREMLDKIARIALRNAEKGLDQNLAESGTLDADNLAILIGSQFLAVGRLVRFVGLAEEAGRFTHVVTEVRHAGTWIRLDPFADKTRYAESLFTRAHSVKEIQ